MTLYLFSKAYCLNRGYCHLPLSQFFLYITYCFWKSFHWTLKKATLHKRLSGKSDTQYLSKNARKSFPFGHKVFCLIALSPFFAIFFVYYWPSLLVTLIIGVIMATWMASMMSNENGCIMQVGQVMAKMHIFLFGSKKSFCIPRKRWQYIPDSDNVSWTELHS